MRLSVLRLLVVGFCVLLAAGCSKPGASVETTDLNKIAEHLDNQKLMALMSTCSDDCTYKYLKFISNSFTAAGFDYDLSFRNACKDPQTFTTASLKGWGSLYTMAVSAIVKNEYKDLLKPETIRAHKALTAVFDKQAEAMKAIKDEKMRKMEAEMDAAFNAS